MAHSRQLRPLRHCCTDLLCHCTATAARHCRHSSEISADNCAAVAKYVLSDKRQLRGQIRAGSFALTARCLGLGTEGAGGEGAGGEGEEGSGDST